MKKTSVALSLVLIAFACNAQRVSSDKVPVSVQKTLKEKAPKAMNTKWEIEHGNYEANFRENKMERSMLFDKSGNMLESEIAILINELPKNIPEYITQHYKGSKIKDAAKITKANGEVNFEAEVNKMDVLFDINGKFIKESKD